MTYSIRHIQRGLTLLFTEGGYDLIAKLVDEGGEVRQTSAFHVESIGGKFPDVRPACLVGATRSWNCPQLSAGCFVAGDVKTNVNREPSGGLMLAVSDTRGERMVTARICDGGPVLDCQYVEPMWAVAAFGNVVYSIETNEYGRLCRSVLSQQGAMADVSFRIQSYLASVLMDDLTISRTVGVESFDEAGHFVYDLISSDSVTAPCHTIIIYQESVQIGEAVYGNGPMPKEWR